MLSGSDELSGYDIKKWANWSLRFFYQSPAYSQIYSELRKLEDLGLVVSRLENDGSARNRRLYKITPRGLEAIATWTSEAPYDPPTLKHSVLLRVTFGHLTQPAKLRELLQEHVAYCDRMQREARIEAQAAEDQPAWAYAKIALRWAERYYVGERELALDLIKDIDEAEAEFGKPIRDGSAGIPWPDREYWYEVERRLNEEPPD